MVTRRRLRKLLEYVERAAAVRQSAGLNEQWLIGSGEKKAVEFLRERLGL